MTAKGMALAFVFGATLFLSACLMFVVEPMISKMVLPRLGGSPSVWSTCLFFFQACLLLGYLYAHGIGRAMATRWQILVHVGLLIGVAVFALPIGLSPAATAPGGPPVVWLVIELSLAVGAPIVAISATAPLLQLWFSKTHHVTASDPYFLYAASNAGSLLALVAYPFAIEPNLALGSQASDWSIGFGVLVAGLAICGFLTLRQQAAPATAALLTAGTSTRERLLWTGLAFVPSSLLIGVTAHIGTDIASAPLFWVLPLALYLITFILAFARRPPLPHRVMRRFLPLMLIPVTLVGAPLVLPVASLLMLHLGAFFVIAMVCHGTLAQRRPETRRLTEFYFFLSLGGVFGGLFNAILAPLVFPDLWEYPLVLVASCFLIEPGAAVNRISRTLDLVLPPTLLGFLLLVRSLPLATDGHVPLSLGLCGYLIPAFALMWMSERRLRFAFAIAACALAPLITGFSTTLLTARSFFGVYRVTAVDGGLAHLLIHGTTTHGAQSLLPGEANLPVGYYWPDGPFGKFFAALPSRPGRRIAVVGLGTGGLGCYARPDDDWTFYEIDPLIEQIARDSRYFTFMKICGNHASVVLGDARLTLSGAPDGRYDALVIDAFTSDSIPIHLLTAEAMALYLRKLAPGGTLLFHVSNRYLDVAKVVESLGFGMGGQVRFLQDTPPSSEGTWRRLSTAVVAITSAGGTLDFLTAADGWITPPVPPTHLLWTDQRSDILSILRIAP
jgi:hypothetical protein